MSGTPLIANWLGYGLAANRPAKPLISNNGTALYYATDTNHMYAWSGTLAAGSWKTVI